MQADQVQQPGNRRDFIALVVGGLLGKHQFRLRRPDADHVDGRLGRGGVKAVTQGFAVDAQPLLPARIDQPLHPRQKATLERLGIERGEHPAERVVAGNPMGQVKKGLQPVPLALAEVLHIRPALRSANHRQNRNGQNVVQSMQLRACHAGIVQRIKMAQQTARPVAFHAQAPSVNGLSITPGAPRASLDTITDQPRSRQTEHLPNICSGTRR